MYYFYIFQDILLPGFGSTQYVMLNRKGKNKNRFENQCKTTRCVLFTIAQMPLLSKSVERAEELSKLSIAIISHKQSTDITHNPH